MKDALVTGIARKIMARVKGHGRGRWIFSASDFLDGGSRDAASKALSRLAKDGDLKRLSRGVYYFPRHNKILGKDEPPQLSAVLNWIARKSRTWIVPDHIVAAHQLGLTDAVPANLVFYTNGPSRLVTFGGWRIELRRAPLEMMAWAKSPARVAIQAMQWLGKAASMKKQAINDIRSHLSRRARASLKAHAESLPDWMAGAARMIAT